MGYDILIKFIFIGFANANSIIVVCYVIPLKNVIGRFKKINTYIVST